MNQHKLILEGIQEGQDLAVLTEKMATIFKSTEASAAEKLDKLKQGQRIVLAKDLSATTAEQYKSKLESIGLRCSVEGGGGGLSLQLALEEEKQVCPACSYAQAPVDGKKFDICPKCGVVVSKYEANADVRKLMEEEKKKIEARRMIQMENQRRAEEANKQEQLRDEAKRKVEELYGIRRRKQRGRSFKIAAAVMAFVLVPAGAWYLQGYLQAQRQQEELAKQAQAAQQQQDEYAQKVEQYKDIIKNGRNMPEGGDPLMAAIDAATMGSSDGQGETGGTGSAGGSNAATGKNIAELASAMGQSGKLSKADLFAGRAVAYAKIALHQARAGGRDSAPQIMKKAMEIMKSGTIPAATKALIQQQQVAMLLALAKHEREFDSDAAMQLLEQASSTAEGIGDEAARAESIAMVASGQRAVGLPAADKTFQKAAALAKQIANADQRVLALGAVARQQTEAGQNVPAQETLKQATVAAASPVAKGNLMKARIEILQIIAARAGRGDKATAQQALEQARELANALPSAADKGVKLSEIARSQVEIGEGASLQTTIDTALAQVGKLPNGRERAEALAAIRQQQVLAICTQARQQSELGRSASAEQLFKQAVVVTKNVSPAGDRAVLLSTIAEYQALAGDKAGSKLNFAEALQLAGNADRLAVPVAVEEE